MIQSLPNAPEGSVTSLSPYTIDTFRDPTSAVLCRNGAPLISLAFGLISRGTGVRFLGRDIGTGLISLVKKTSASDLEELKLKLGTSRDREIARAVDRGALAQVAAIEDKYSCLDLFVERATSVPNVISAINELFDERKRGLITFATIHKAKGLEWESVFLLDFHALLPSKWAKAPWQQRQEKNLQYVAVTRAKLNLIFIDSNNWEDAR